MRCIRVLDVLEEWTGEIHLSESESECFMSVHLTVFVSLYDCLLA